VDVIGHDDPSREVVALAVEVEQAALDDGAHVGAAEVTLAFTGIEPLFQAQAESFVVFTPLFIAPRLRVVSEPDGFLLLPGV
jgi:hypothetical protein